MSCRFLYMIYLTKWTDLHAKVYKFITFEVNDKCCTFLHVLSR